MRNKPLTIGGIILVLVVVIVIKVRPTIVSEIFILGLNITFWFIETVQWFVGLFLR